MKRYLTQTEQARLLNAAKQVADPLAQRDFHCMSALLLTGMRITEFTALTVPQVQQALLVGWLVSLPAACKGGRANDYVVTEQLRVHLRALVRYASLLTDQVSADAARTGLPLVPGRDGQPLSVRAVQLRVKYWVTEAGLDPRISPHWLRHTRGMNILRCTRAKDPRQALLVVKEALGHASLKSTGVYLSLSREELASEIRAVDAGGGRLSRKQARAAMLAEVA